MKILIVLTSHDQLAIPEENWFLAGRVCCSYYVLKDAGAALASSPKAVSRRSIRSEVPEFQVNEALPHTTAAQAELANTKS